MLWINTPYLWVAFAATLFLIGFHLLSHWFSRQLPRDSNAFSSFSGGVAIAYVFLYMLPNLVEYNKPIGKLLVHNQWLTPFTELFIYIVALAGFIIYYGFDLLAERHKAQAHDDGFVYALHVSLLCLYNFLITYTMSLRAMYSTTATCLFTIAMALRFVLTDRKFSRLYETRFNHVGRYLLSAALLIGWLLSVLFDPVNVLFSAFMISFLSGSVLLNVFRDDLPATELTDYAWFTAGASIITIILLGMVTFHTH